MTNALPVGDQLITVLAAMLGGGFLAALVQGVFQRRKLGADYADVIAKSATGLLVPLQERVEDLQAELEHERARVRRLATDLDLANDSLVTAREAVRMLTKEVHALRRQIREGTKEAS